MKYFDKKTGENKILNDKSDVKKIDQIRNEISKFPEELKAELKEQGFDINNDQHVYDLYIETKEAKKSQAENANQILSEAELDSISGGAQGIDWKKSQKAKRLKEIMENPNHYRPVRHRPG
nr:NT02FT0260 [synthetic construct]